MRIDDGDKHCYQVPLSLVIYSFACMQFLISIESEAHSSV